MTWSSDICPRCGREVEVGILSLAATCECGLLFACVGPPAGGWYADREAYRRGEKWEQPR